MIASTDFGALNWIKDDLDELIVQARQALEAYVEEQEDEQALERCADRLHQVAAVLQMAQVYGPGMLAEEMEAVADDMSQGRVMQQEDAAEALMLALIQLPDYLEKLQGGDADIPLIILPLLNDLRAVRDAPLLSEAALFKPEIEQGKLPDRITGEPNAQLPELAQQLRQRFHLGLLSWYRKKQVEQGWEYLKQVFDELEQHAGTQQVHRLAWVAGALMRGLIDKSISSGIAVKQLFSKIDRQLKLIIDHGEQALIDHQQDDLFKNLLYYVAQSDSEDSRILQVKEAYDLNSVLPSEMELAQGREGLTGSNAELAASIKEAIQSELTRVKDVLDLYMRDQAAEADMLAHLEQPLRKLSDTLGMIGHGELRSRLQRQAEKVHAFVERDEPPQEYELMEMAGDILYVESSLGTLQSAKSPPAGAGTVEGEWGLDLPEGEYANLIRQTVREAKVDIARAKEAIIGYTESFSEPELLQGVHEAFFRVTGALKILELNDLAHILESTTDFVKDYLIDAQQKPDRQQLNSLADVISSVEYFLEALVDGAGDRQEIINIAQTALSGLLAQPEGMEPAQPDMSAEVIPLTASMQQEVIEELPAVDESASAIEQPTTDTESTGEVVTEIDETPVASADKPALEDIDPEILEIFIEEAREELETIQRYLPAWKNNQDDNNALITFRRSFHTLKGSGRLVGAKLIGELAWSVENMLNRIIDETIKVTPEVLGLLDQVQEVLPGLIDCQERAVSPEMDVDAIIQQAFALADGRTLSEAEIPSGSEQVLAPADDAEITAATEQDTLELAETDSLVESEHEVTEVEAEVSIPVADELASELSLEETTIETVEGDTTEDFADSDLMVELDTELLEVFAEESESHLQAIQEFISATESCEPRPLITEEILRAYHTLNGSARMAGINPIASMSKAVEDYLKTLIEKKHFADDGVLQLLQESVSYTQEFLQSLQDEQQPAPETESFLNKLEMARQSLLEAMPTVLDLEEQAQTADESVASMEQADLAAVSESSEQQLIEPEDDSSQFQLEGDVFEVAEDPELVEVFVEEAMELVESIQTHYQDLVKHEGDWDQATLAEIHRGLHTLKGSARLAGVIPVGDLSYALESIFNTFAEGRVTADKQLLDKIDQGLETLTAQTKEVMESAQVHPADKLVSELESVLHDIHTGEKAAVSESLQAETLEEATSELQLGVQELASDMPLEPDEIDSSSFYAEPISLLEGDNVVVVGEDPELLEVFLDETKELLEELESRYQQWTGDSTEPKTIDEIHRILHTLKGSARLAGVTPVGDLSHALESVFNGLSAGQLSADEPTLDLVRQSMDYVATQIEDAETQGKVQRADNLIQQLQALQSDVEATLVEPTSELEEQVITAEAEIPEAESVSSISDEPLSLPQEDTQVEVGEDSELVGIFIEEAKELIEHLESGFEDWIANTDEVSLIDGIQRHLHTLKGSARLAGISPVGNLSHAVESLMTSIMEGKSQASDTLLALTRQAVDKLATQIDEIVTTGKVSPAEQLVAELEAMQAASTTETGAQRKPLLQEAGEETGSELEKDTPDQAVVLPFVSEVAKRAEARSKASTTAFKPTKDQVRINAELMDRLVNNAGEVSIYRARLEQQNSVLGFNLSELEQTVSRLHNQLRNLEIETEAQILYRWERDSEKDEQEKAEFDPLELDRFSNMQQLSRALMETVSDLSSINDSLTELQRETDTLLLQQSRISTDLQDGLLRTRMVPFVQLVPRMQRLVRQTADQLEKKAKLDCFGSEGELDRNILNRMVPVLEHLLRNAVSHGIEPPEDRSAANKDEMGQISLYIDREATDVLITLTDDGRGLDLEAIRNKAVQQGLFAQDAEVSDDDLIQCVLNPGFSTATEVTQIAGRGVGLDVVASEVKQLGGSLNIDSHTGRGTSFTIRLPLTLAITDALLVRVADETYAIPHGSVEGVVRISYEELQACYRGAKEHYVYAGRNYTTTHLGQMLGFEQTEPSDAIKWFPLLLVHVGERHYALQVDELLGTQQIVIKTVGKQVGSVRWITGGTIQADGRVALILDVGALVRMQASNITTMAPVKEAAQALTEDRLRVMVVDDSITVRKVTSRLLERHDMAVITAKDGVEAVALLQDQIPDIMLLDIEMPRMDGFELARHINNSVDYYGLPIIMITSRVGEKHRQRAFDLGVKRCLGKPYQEMELLDAINEVLTEANP